MADMEIKTQSPVGMPPEAQEVSPAVREMIDAGVFFGRTKSHTHPKMKPFVVGNRNGVDIINLNKTLEGLEAAEAFIKGKVESGGEALVVATQAALQDLALAFAKQTGTPFVVRRWLGGTLTNFKIIAKRIEYYKKLKNDFASGSLEKYTKKERLSFEREMKRLEELLGGLEFMQKLPSVLIIVDPNVHATALREAKRMNIPVVVLANVDVDPATLNFAVVGNNKGRSSVKWFLDKIAAAVEAGKKAAMARAAEIQKSQAPQAGV